VDISNILKYINMSLNSNWK